MIKTRDLYSAANKLTNLISGDDDFAIDECYVPTSTEEVILKKIDCSLLSNRST